ncbi:MAG: tetratricopeptide repeat protein [Candidatus Gracilibacteria bacterium]|nr:tetratricopeptide repeat protein [Candidatus Gracilibacteria bacterium]
MNPGGYHWTNLLLHLLSTIFLFLALNKMTDSVWKSGFVAVLFAIHPQHVESVAWIAERKDVLSGVFWMLTLWLYAFYVEKPVLTRYLALLLAFVCGMMAKPMLVTLPFVLLLLDIWPLKRLSLSNWGKNFFSSPDKKTSISFIFLEKIPFIFISGIASWMVVYTEKKVGALASLSSVPLLDRLFNAVIAYTTYIVKTFYPVNLAVFYPYASSYNIWEVVLSLGLLVWITMVAVVTLKREPYVAVGWLWFLGTLIPVIGLVQVGSHAMADRYTYIPLIGLFITITWGTEDFIKRFRCHKVMPIFVGSLVILILSVLTYAQLGKWRNTETLFRHALKATGSSSYVAYNGLGNVMLGKGKPVDALFYFRNAITVKPNYDPAVNNAGIALMLLGKKKEAMNYFHTATIIAPDYSGGYYNLGIALKDEDDFLGAETAFRKAISIAPEERDYYYWLAFILLQQNHVEEARDNYRKYLRLQKGPIQLARDKNNAEAQTVETAMVNYYLGLACVDKGKYDLAIDFYKQAIVLTPKMPFLHNNLGVALTEEGYFADAAVAYREAIRLDPKHAGAYNNLGMVLLKMGHVADAAIQFREAIRLQPNFANSHFYLAKILVVQGQKNEAKKHLRRAGELNIQYAQEKKVVHPLFKISF